MDYVDGFAKSAGLSRQEASDQISAMIHQVADWEDFDEGVKDGAAFKKTWPENWQEENCPICGAKAEWKLSAGNATVAIGTGCIHVYLDGPNFGFLR